MGWNRSACVQDDTHTRAHRSIVRGCHRKKTFKYVALRRGTNNTTTYIYSYNRITLTIRNACVHSQSGMYATSNGNTTVTGNTWVSIVDPGSRIPSLALDTTLAPESLRAKEE